MKWVIGVLVAAICASSTAVAADGFGRYTTGGSGGEVKTIDGNDANAATMFKTYVETVNTPYVVQVRGTLSLEPVGGKISFQSNKTIRGIGEAPTIIGELGFKNKMSNVIIERLRITNPYGWGEKDGVQIKEDITNVIVTKCTIFDCADGLVDVSRRSDNITVSWCKFYFTQPGNSNNRASLIGAGDSHTDDYGKLRVTFHHNWFGTNCWQRIPSVRFGKAHLYNNYYDCPNNLYGVWSRIKAECLIENNYFKNVRDPYSIHVESEPAADYGKISAVGNLFENCIGVIDAGDDIVFTPPYPYAPDDARHVPIIVQRGAGADGIDFFPHWLFVSYGDFDLSGIVNRDDLTTFIDYWLSVEDIADADYDGDGIVNHNEFALLAINWLRLPDDTTPPAAPEGFWALGRNGRVSLTWADNTEPDMDGYSVYRSTAWGAGYVRLNEPPLTTAGYVDTDVVNGTLYYYRVCAVDTRGNESDASLYGCARPAEGEDSLTLQEDALGFCSVQGIVDYGKHAGFTGAGFLDVTNSIGTGIRWKVNVAAAGSYTFRWRYANASGDRPGRLLIDGTESMASISFAGTGDWATWSEVSVDTTLSEGIHEIRLEGINSDSLANIDSLQIIGEAPEAAACP